MAINIGTASASAACRSAAPNKPTSLPIKTGVTVSLKATNRQLNNMATKMPRFWPTKCP